MLGEHFAIGAIKVAIVLRQVAAWILAEKARQAIPRDARMDVVQDVVIVVEEQKRKRALVVDDDGAAPCFYVGLMFQESTDFQKRQPTVGGKTIGPKRNCRDSRKPNNNSSECGDMPGPTPEDAGISAAVLPVRAQEAGGAKKRANEETPGQRVVGGADGFGKAGHFIPVTGIDIVAFGIVVGVG